MILPRLRKFVRPAALSLIAAPLALGLAACNKGDTSSGSTEAPTSSTALAKVAPPAGTSWADKVVKTDEGGYRIGNPDAPIKLIEYGALSCSHCALFAKQGFDTLRSDYVASGRVSYELRYFMLNPYDVPAALLATCGTTEAVLPLSEQFWAWQPNMFNNLQSAGDAKLQQIQSLPQNKQIAAIADTAGMTQFFASRGISSSQAQACLADTTKAKALADNTETATTKYNVSGTPTFLINGAQIGSMEWAELETKLKEAGAR